MIISRQQWRARAPRGTTAFSGTGDPAIHWNGPATQLNVNSSQGAEESFMRGTQNFHMDSRGWNDFAYNYAVAPSGRIYEGRGRNNRSAANGSTAENVARLAIFLMVGEGQDIERPLIEAVNWLLHDLGFDDVVGHRDIRATECPGDHIYSMLAQFNGTTQSTETTTQVEVTPETPTTSVSNYELPEFMLERLVDNMSGQEVASVLFQHHLGRKPENRAQSHFAEAIYNVAATRGWHEAIRQINFELYNSDEAKNRRS